MESHAVESVLVDSNVFIGLLRRGHDPIEVLGNWIGDSDLATCGMVRVEVLRGLRERRIRDTVAGFMDVMLNVIASNPIWEQTAALAWELDRRGHVIPAQDIFIATCAHSIGAAVLTDDQHFRRIPNLVVYEPSLEFEEW